MKHLKDTFKSAGPDFFKSSDPSLLYSLKRIFLEILADERCGQLCFIVDALDECDGNLTELVDIILATSQRYGVYWVVSSRKLSGIKMKLDPHACIIDLEENKGQVEGAIEMYINERVKRYDPDIREEIIELLKKNSESTFLWIHLALKRLDEVPDEDFFDELKKAPKGLKAFYERMFEQISQSSQTAADLGLTHQMLAIVLTAFRPLYLAEITSLLQIPANLEALLHRKESPDIFLIEKVRG
ncbi:hypothetical protein H072_9887 [Dactylellina haptotyla CBS 200.50]|uniref:NACHT domain-containing protein n=1 Tax=Dactylellina haptotyla (strain CBS 200.50) TaxID=1284197 RepID=S8A1N2_DACHA|nr:hypothetical protein H072_9887 [Dactylellina haptotyla CBS 200.50]